MDTLNSRRIVLLVLLVLVAVAIASLAGAGLPPTVGFSDGPL